MRRMTDDPSPVNDWLQDEERDWALSLPSDPIERARVPGWSGIAEVRYLQVLDATGFHQAKVAAERGGRPTGAGGPPRGAGLTIEDVIEMARAMGDPDQPDKNLPTQADVAERLFKSDRRVRQVVRPVGWTEVLRRAGYRLPT